MGNELLAKRLGILHELVPKAARFAMLAHSSGLGLDTMITDMAAAASAIGRQFEVMPVSDGREIDLAFKSLMQMHTDGLLIAPAPLFLSQRFQIVTLATRHALPILHFNRQFAQAGGLMSYAAPAGEQERQVGIYTGRILKGEKPADLPVMRATKFEFVINLQTARAMGIEVPPTLLAIADEVIE
jgi:ABC-type uncharacterized transport system substrate-binding protein